MLHGGGMSGDSWRYQYDQGWFGDISGLKFVFPDSRLTENGAHLWYKSHKNGCGLADDCAYDLDSIHQSAEDVK